MIKSLHINPFDALQAAQTEMELLEFQKATIAEGYYCFYSIIKSFQLKLKTFMDEEIEEVGSLIAKAERLFPRPIEFSLSFQYIWKELEDIRAYKAKILHTIAKTDRAGEWQVIMDNPLTTQEVVCYPALKFDAAAYLYGYFRPQLEKTEYIRIQKIQTVIQDYGP